MTFLDLMSMVSRTQIVRLLESSGRALRRRNNFRSRDGHEIGSAALISNGAASEKTQKKKKTQIQFRRGPEKGPFNSQNSYFQFSPLIISDFGLLSPYLQINKDLPSAKRSARKKRIFLVRIWKRGLNWNHQRSTIAVC